MKTGISFLILAVLGLAYVGHAKLWKSVSHTETVSAALPEIPAPVRLAPEVTAKRKTLTSVIHVLQDSHQVFSEAWRLLLGSQAAVPNSAMKALANRLTQHLSQHQDILSESELCPKDHNILDMKGLSSGYQISLQHKSCSRPLLDPVVLIRWTPETKKEGGYKMTLEAHPNQLLEGVGESLAMLNVAVSCEFQIAENEKLNDFSCKNLGQGVQRAQHFFFSRFEYHANQHDLLIVDADRYVNLMEKTTCVSSEPCFRLQVPLEGKIKIVENRKMGKTKPVPVLNVVSTPSISVLPPVANLQEEGQQLPQQPLPPPNPAQTAQLTQILDTGLPGVVPGVAPGVVAEQPIADQDAQPPLPPQENSNLNSSPRADITAAAPNADAQGEHDTNTPTQKVAVIKAEVPAASEASAEAVQDPTLQGYPVNDQDRSSSPGLQPASNAGEDIQPRQPTGEKNNPVFLPEGQYSGLHD
jgi:hypothetical protein